MIPHSRPLGANETNVSWSLQTRTVNAEVCRGVATSGEIMRDKNFTFLMRLCFFFFFFFLVSKCPSVHLSCQTTRRWTPLSWSSHVVCVSVRPATAAAIPGSALMTASLSSTTSCLLCSLSSSASPWKDGQPCSITYDSARTRTHAHTHGTDNISPSADKYWLTDASCFNLQSNWSNK